MNVLSRRRRVNQLGDGETSTIVPDVVVVHDEGSDDERR